MQFSSVRRIRCRSCDTRRLRRTRPVSHQHVCCGRRGLCTPVIRNPQLRMSSRHPLPWQVTSTGRSLLQLLQLSTRPFHSASALNSCAGRCWGDGEAHAPAPERVDKPVGAWPSSSAHSLGPLLNARQQVQGPEPQTGERDRSLGVPAQPPEDAAPSTMGSTPVLGELVFC